LRPLIGFLLIAAAATGGCDRQSDAPEQANATESVVATAPAPLPETDDNVTVETIGRLDRSNAGDPAPDFAFTAPDGSDVTLADFRGRPVLLNLWATWCAPCIAEMPTLDALAAREGDSLTVLTLSQDFDGSKVLPFFRERGLTHLQPYRDEEMQFSLAMQTNLPTTILYDSDGNEVWRMLGGMNWTGEAAAALIDEAQ